MNLGLFLAACFLHNFGIGIVPPLLVDIQRDLRLSLLEISLVTAAFGIGRLFADIPGGAWIDRVGYFRVFTTGIILGLVGTAASGLASSPAVLLGGRLFVGLGHALKAVGGLSIIMDKYGPSRWGRVMNLLEFTGIFALTVSALAAGKLTVLFGWRIAFFFALAMGALSLLVVLLGIHWEGEWEIRTEIEPSSLAADAPDRKVGAWPPAGLLVTEAAILGGAFVLAFGYAGLFQTVLPLRSGLRLGLDAGQISLLMTGGYVTDLLLLIPVGFLSDRAGKDRLLAGGLLALLVGALWFGIGAGAFAMGLAAVLCGASLSTSMMPPAVLVTRGDRRTRGKILGLYRFVTDTAYILGPVTLGFVAEHQGYRAAGMAFAAVVAVVFLLVILRLPRLSMRAG